MDAEVVVVVEGAGVFMAVGLVVHVHVHSWGKGREMRCRCSVSNTEQLNFNKYIRKSLLTGFPTIKKPSALLASGPS